MCVCFKRAASAEVVSCGTAVWCFVPYMLWNYGALLWHGIIYTCGIVGMVWNDMAWYGFASCFCVVLFIIQKGCCVWHGMAWYGTILRCVGVVYCCVVLVNMAWYGMVWCDAAHMLLRVGCVVLCYGVFVVWFRVGVLSLRWWSGIKNRWRAAVLHLLLYLTDTLGVKFLDSSSSP